MQKLVFRNANGIELDLTTDPFGITEWEGFSADELNIQSQQVPFQDGGVFLDALLNERTLSVTVAMNDGNDLEKRYRLRREMISKLNPKLGEGVLIYTNDFLSKQIHCIPQLPVFENHNSNDSGTPKASCSFQACNPYWEDLEDTEITLIGGDNNIIRNAGDIPCNIKCRYFGKNLENPYIKNNTNNKVIKLDGTFNLPISINTNTGKKEIYEEDISFNNLLIGHIMKRSYYCKELDIFVLYCSSGFIFTSKTAEDWEMKNTNITENLLDIVYNPNLNLLIAVGANGTIITSPDAKNWEIQTSGIGEGINIKRIINGYNNKLIALTSNNKIISSTDSINWVESATISGTINDIVYSKKLNMYLAVGTNRSIYKSSDVENWTKEDISGDNTFVSIVYSEEEELFLAVAGSGAGYKSTDGENWEDVYFGPLATRYKVYYIPEKSSFAVLSTSGVIVNDSGSMNSWTTYTENSFYPYTMAYSSSLGIFIITDTNGQLWKSFNIKNWERENENNNISLSYPIRSIVYSENLKTVYAVCEYYIGKSIDYKNWTFEFIQSYGAFSKIINAKGMLIAIGGGGVISTSADGENWNTQRVNPLINLNSITYAEDKGLFVIVGSNGSIFTSADGEVWTSQTSGITRQIWDITYSEKHSLFVAVCTKDNDTYYKSCLKSSDGINWAESVILTPQGTSVAITYSKELDLFVAVGSAGSIATSYDASNWTVTYLTGSYYHNIIYSKEYNMFIAVADDGKIITSPDCKNWEEKNIYGDINLYCCYYSKLTNNILIGGEQKTIFISKFVDKTNIIDSLDSDSNINFTLEVGDNNVLLACKNGNATGYLSYRQKYIGV